MQNKYKWHPPFLVTDQITVGLGRSRLGQGNSDQFTFLFQGKSVVSHYPLFDPLFLQGNFTDFWEEFINRSNLLNEDKRTLPTEILL